MRAPPTIPILPPQPAGGCSACARHEGRRLCQGPAEGSAEAPALSGPADELQRLLHALAHSLGFAPEAPAQGGVRGLRIAPGEVELQLAPDPQGRSVERADTAFQTLRRLLADTDIYVTHRC
jgi:hypothetical protein